MDAAAPKVTWEFERLENEWAPFSDVCLFRNLVSINSRIPCDTFAHADSAVLERRQKRWANPEANVDAGYNESV